jgi:hypothetical protein
METPKGVIFSSHAMARFVAGIRRDSGLLGSSLQEQAAIDAWMDWAAQDVELPCCVWFYPVAGYIPFHKEAYVVLVGHCLSLSLKSQSFGIWSWYCEKLMIFFKLYCRVAVLVSVFSSNSSY